MIDPRPARTATEAAMAASRALPDCGSDLFAGADMFNAVAYGDRPAGEPDYRAMSGIDDRVTAAADSADLTDEPVPSGTGRAR